MIKKMVLVKWNPENTGLIPKYPAVAIQQSATSPLPGYHCNILYAKKKTYY